MIVQDKKSSVNTRQLILTLSIPVRFIVLLSLVMIGLISCSSREKEKPAEESTSLKEEFEFTFRTRSDNQVKEEIKQIDPENMGIVVIDMWNHHWCKTAANRVSTMVPRFNKSFETARKLGMKIFWAPTDGIARHMGTMPRERAAAVPYHKLNEIRDLQIDFTHSRNGCLCGPGIHCMVDYGWDGLNPDLNIEEETDYVISSTLELYSLCKELDITTLIYSGVHTNICVVGKPPALKNMYNAGIEGYLARDLTDAFISPIPAEGISNEQGTADIVEDIENSGIGSINFGELMSAFDKDNSDVITEQVRLVPWGIKSRPYFFSESTTIAMTSPWLQDVEFRYTLDGSQPTLKSNLYSKPFKISSTTTIRTVAYKEEKVASLPNEGEYVLIPPTPPMPDIYLSDLEKIVTEPLGWVFSPLKDFSYDGKVLNVGGEKYEKGIGMRSPAEMLFELKPEYDRFVATVGIDRRFLSENKNPRPGFHGWHVARYPSVEFRIFIDGKMVQTTPVMRIGSTPWHFDIKIPEESRRLSITLVSTGNPHPLELGNWVNSGFLLKK